ncbi:DUF1850 domain-containing protein [Lonepinella sp. BR2919]|uniref:DUF1850 domain-containing protein n=1 Tax=unclassified Lonepinella TaxID=2642006 RepID=UPI003F6E1D93
MMKTSKITGYPLCALNSLLFSFLIIMITLWPTTHIVIQSALPNNQVLRCVWNSDKFSLKWQHSVEKQYWQENYQLQGKQFLLVNTYIQAFGAGTPSTGHYINAPQGYVGFESQLSFTELNWVVSPVMQGVILSDKGSFPIFQKVPSYTTVHISPITYPYIKWLFMEHCNYDNKKQYTHR